MGKKRYFNKKRKYEDVFSQNKFDDDIVFSRFINYMQIALYHKKLDYDKHQEFLMSQPTTELEQAYEDEEQIKYIREYNLKKKAKKEARRIFVNNLMSKIKKFITRR